jgi:Zn-dependent protease with chaperone function
MTFPKPSPAFRQQVRKVIGAIMLFVIVYLLLVLAAVALAIACGWLGIFLILHLSNFAILLVALGIIGVGISVIYFLIKFIFAVARDENSTRTEITEAEQPRLFAFIRQLAQETQTPFPKKVYLSPDVNACVFYNSSFWSMFLPVRKNLEIGLGLVNSINISEFKAVVAHEFGHFSQKSMKLGSFTYNVNRVIYNMLFENKDYTAFLQSWGNLHTYLRIFAGITVKIANSIQWLLRGMYKVINRSYLGLSREMEFHADAVAASVSGGNNLVSALSRVEVAGSCYNTVLKDANDQLKERKIARNIYPNQLTVFRSLAAEYRLPLRHGLPEVSYSFIESFSRSRINYKDQWASHPTLPERAASLDRLAIHAAPDESSAWLLFDQVETLQETITGSLYRSVTFEGPAQPYNASEFEERYLRNKTSYALPVIYKGFYDGRYIDIKDWNIDTLADAPASAFGFDHLFNEENCGLNAAIISNRNDVEILKAIRDKKIAITSYDFDGKKHRAADCDTLIAQLQKEIDAQLSRQQELDKAAFLFFLRQPNTDTDRLKANYRRFRAQGIRNEEFVTIVNKLLKRLNPFYTGKISLAQVRTILDLLKKDEEAALKQAYRQLLENWAGPFTGSTSLTDPGTAAFPDPLQGRIRDFLSKDYVYFLNDAFLDNELNELTGLAREVATDLNRQQFESYKKLLEAQAETFNTNS